MAKGQMRSTKEPKKPKKAVAEKLKGAAGSSYAQQMRTTAKPGARKS